MKRGLIIVATASLATLWPMGCSGQDRPLDDPSEISREEWQAHVKVSRERIETMRREHKSFIPRGPTSPTSEELAEEASRRILEDDSLMPGDIVATNRGLFRFQGSPDRERRPDDFVRIR